jgi:hypothetical protein
VDEKQARELWESAPRGWENTLDVARQIVAAMGDVPEVIAYEMLMGRDAAQRAEFAALRRPDAKPYTGNWI